MNASQNNVISHVLMQVKPGAIVDEDLIRKYVNVYSMIDPVTEEEKEEVIVYLHAKLLIRMDRGASVREKDHKTWYYTAKKDIKPKFWDRFLPYLYKDVGFNSEVVHSLDAATDEMMDLIGNPKTDYSFQRRGLVIGDVQSGKTATYTALLNKAGDAGYRVVILLTGTIEKLRRQTQKRIDEGFVGLDSSALIKDKDNVYVGVGNYDPEVQCFVLTSTSSDFNKATASKFNGKLASFNDPVLFVLKKNKSVLEKLEQWLRLFNAIEGRIYSPLLLIDDEADNASVNTKGDGESPTAINSAIRKLLKLFVKASYVGFTATPYANVFINPDSNEEMLDDDLFPRDFIYALEAPTNYVGARSIFSEGGLYSYMLKDNDDCERYLPQKHTIDFTPDALPLSMKKSIVSFFIANAIRDLRGQKIEHRTMLINISRFIAVQEQIKKGVDGYVRDMQLIIRNYNLTGDAALQYEQFSFIKSVYDEHFAHIDSVKFSWPKIQKALNEAVAPIVVRTVNGGNAPKNLNYDECEEEGLRLIAVGGFSLSRGLTLEGLCVSYFYRNSKMYDTLMQMGRWFGYREEYADICQIWMNEEAINWYSYISVASDELRREIRKMQDAKKTPRDFGLCVRSDISTLLVTARNKMRCAKDYNMTVTLNGKVIETPYLHIDKKVLGNNFDVTRKFIDTIRQNGFNFSQNEDLAVKHPQILNVPKIFILEYLGNYKSHPLNMEFSTSDLIHIINEYTDSTVDLWDVEIGGGLGDEDFIFYGEKPVRRRFEMKEETGALQMSGKGARLSSANFAKGGITKKLADQIETHEKDERIKYNDPDPNRGFPQETYFRSGFKRNPLLVILPVQLDAQTKGDNGNSDERKKEYIADLKFPIIGLSIGIPEIEGHVNIMYQYKINVVKYKEIFGVEAEDFEEIDETIEVEYE